LLINLAHNCKTIFKNKRLKDLYLHEIKAYSSYNKFIYRIFYNTVSRINILYLIFHSTSFKFLLFLDNINRFYKRLKISMSQKVYI